MLPASKAAPFVVPPRFAGKGCPTLNLPKTTPAATAALTVNSAGPSLPPPVGLNLPPDYLENLKAKMNQFSGSDTIECRHGRSCFRVECPHTHTNGREIEDDPMKAMCSFNRKCLNHNCFFQHPFGRDLDENPEIALCRLGNACTNSECMYVHPDGRKRGPHKRFPCYHCGLWGHDLAQCPNRHITKVILSGFQQHQKEGMKEKLAKGLELFGTLAFPLEIDKEGRAVAIFKDSKSANKAVKALNGQHLKARLDYDPDYDKSTSVVIKNLGYQVAEDDLVDKVSKAGLIRSLRVCRDKRTQESKGYAFCDFWDNQAAQKLIASIHNTDFNGRKLRAALLSSEPPEKKEKVYYAEVSGFPDSWTRQSPTDLAKRIEGELYMYGPFESPPDIIEGGTKAIVSFKDLKLANEAVAALKGILFDIKHCEDGYRPPRHGFDRFDKGARIFVSGLSDDTTDEQLWEAFSTIGKIEHASIIYDNDQRSKGFAFVQFQDPASAQEVVDGYHKVELNGRSLHMRWAKDKEDIWSEIREAFPCIF